METRVDRWYSERLQKEMTVRTYGADGTPVLAFPPREMLSDAYEAAGVTETLARWLDGRMIRLVTVGRRLTTNMLPKKSCPLCAR